MVSRQDRKVVFGKVVQPSHLGFKSQSREHSNRSLAATLDRELYCLKWETAVYTCRCCW